jgi:hypothetical protein
LDRVARWMFPLIFVVAMAALWVIYH